MECSLRHVLPLLLLLPGVSMGQRSPGWQQRVHYEMDITLHTEQHHMDAFQRLTYFNHAPDTLYRVFYHLYFNAFQPGSMMAERNRHLPDPDPRVVPRLFNLGPAEVGYHHIHSLTQDGQPVSFEITDTVMEVWLAEPLPPGGRAVFEMHFRSQVPLQTRRSGRDSREGIAYSMTQWYPKIAQYDERGWHPDPYVGREFYAPFGTFDVRLRLPAPFVVGATGVLQNPEEVGHGYDAPGTASQGGAPPDTLLWHFVAEDVHDFAWAADPDYIHDHLTADGVDIHLLYQPDVAETWTRLRDWMPELIRFFSRNYGAYLYPQFTVVQGGDGGMEYPMITLISGYGAPGFTTPRSPGSLLGTTAHELAHMWYYGMLASNEAASPWMDEGFANYTATEAIAHVLGRPSASHLGAHLSVLAAHHLGFFEPLSTPADWFTTNTAYGTAAYSGGQMLVDLLGYVMSDDLRDAWLQAYYDRFKLRHPNPYDVEKVAEDVSGLRLDWYFEQLTHTTHTLDYAVAGLRARRSGDTWTNTLTLRRRDELVLPVDLRLTLADGSVQWVNIPLGVMQGHKPVPPDWIVAEPWLWTAPTYTLEVSTPARVVKAELDPLGRTPDRNRLNNAARFPLQARLLQAPRQSWFHYEAGYRPLAQYAHDFGFGLGLQARGTYLFGRHRLKAMLKLWPQVLLSGGERPETDPVMGEAPDVSPLDGIDYALTYADDLRLLGPMATAAFSARKHLGILENSLSLSKAFGPWTTLGRSRSRLTLTLLHQYQPSARAFNLDAFTWMLGDHAASARLVYTVGQDADRIEAGLEVGGSLKNLLDACRDGENRPVPCPAELDLRWSASHAYVEAIKSAHVGALEGRAHFKWGLGADNLALYKRFRLGAASFEETWRHDAFRTVAATMVNALEDAHFAPFQGPGPVAYLLADRDVARSLGRTPVGSSILAGSLSLSAAPLPGRRWLRPLRLEAFSGIGQAWNTGRFEPGFDADRFIADAGLGLQYDVAGLPGLNRWTAQSDVLSGLQLVARFPLWASDPDLISPGEEALAFRWLIGLQVGP